MTLETIIIQGQSVKVDVKAELSVFDWGARTRWTEDKLTAPSPFRYDKSPSFFVNLTSIEVNGQLIRAGTWKDSGYYDEEWKSGNLVKLLSFMRSETYEETEEYLTLTYGVELKYDDIELTSPNLTLDEVRKPLPADYLKPYKYRSPYLSKRGISEKVQRAMRIGYDRERKAVVIGWFDASQRLVNCKFRAVRGKTFWYAKNALPIKHLVYGIDAVYARKAKTVVLCEAEIDALSYMTWGQTAIAVGGVHFTDKQADIIRRSPIEHLIISADNDKQGVKLREAVKQKLSGYVELSEVVYPLGYKDANEMLVAGLAMPKTVPVLTFARLA